MPKKIGKYELGKTLGTGSFSKVKLGKDCETGKEYAIKIIDKVQLKKEDMEEQLKREIAVMKLLKHPNIVTLTEVLQTGKHIYLILELVTGGELFDKIVEARRFDEPTARRYFQMMILGVYYCHDQGIAHRDLKPENLLLDASDTLKISDFGLSNLQRGGAGKGGTLLNTVCGTPNYVAPEVLTSKDSGQGYNGITADIWSCGVILFVMLAGYLPFEEPNNNKLFTLIERGEYRMARHFTDPVRDIITRMLTVDPEKRFTLDDVIAHPWFQIDFDQEQLKLSKGRRLRIGARDVAQSVSQVQDPDAAGSPQREMIDSVDAMGLVKDGVHVLTSAAKSASAARAASIARSDPIQADDKPLAWQLDQSGRMAVGADMRQAKADCVKILSELKGNPKESKSSVGPEIRGFVNAEHGLLTFIATVDATVLGAELSFVNFRRGRGNTSDFRTLIRGVADEFEKLGKLRSKFIS